MPSNVKPEIKRVLLTNNANMRVELANYGARILSIQFKHPSGEWIETTLNYTADSDILNDAYYMGATCGRVSNRINGAQYSHAGKVIKLLANDDENTLHGGPVGFSHSFWSMGDVQNHENGQSIMFSHKSLSGDQGFPGKLIAKVTYTLTHNNHLQIHYHASCDQISPINMCNHSYFTLGEPSIHDLDLHVCSNKILPLNSHNIPTGEIVTPTANLSFMPAVNLGKTLSSRDLDDCYILLKKSPFDTVQNACTLSSLRNEISLTISTNQVAIQVYSGNYLPQKHSGIALEAQGLVDAVNQAGFESDWVGPHQDYTKTVDYHFQSQTKLD